MLIPKASLARGPGLPARFKRLVAGALASLGLSSQKADAAATRVGTLVAVAAGVIAVVAALFADRLVMSRVQEDLEQEAAAEAEPAQAVTTVPRTRVMSSPPKAEVVADGQLVGVTPLSVARGKSDSLVVIRKPGYEPQMLRIGPDTPDAVQVVLQPQQPEAPPAPTDQPAPTAPTAQPAP